MINVAQSRAYIDATAGDLVAVPKVQLVEMLAEVEVGQHARRALKNIGSMVSIAPHVSGVPA
jgi:hypothetical protein